MTAQKYNLGFTGGALLYRDSVLLSKLYLEMKDWDKVRKIVLEQNLLQIRTLAAQRRIFSETYTRIKELNNDALAIIANGSRDEQTQLIWYAICLKYTIIRDFAIEVISDKVKKFDYDISDADFHVFYNNKATHHDELNRISPQSKRRLIINLFKMLKDTGIVIDGKRIKPIIIAPSTKKIIESEGKIPLDIFPLQK